MKQDFNLYNSFQIEAFNHLLYRSITNSYGSNIPTFFNIGNLTKNMLILSLFYRAP